ncbi:ornithine cyclodeaminase family protein [Desulfopila sp. IMCC35008]|uniref:ornithine cyclodeaminase family protein n=1 Tax=Desulfopila sp. IMCC35008 TaxID=2653858 RepID=UPI0013D2B2DB|nr:ornithine cyclodeaminase family protein [Desulfopila sp. IMCC35008]
MNENRIKALSGKDLRNILKMEDCIDSMGNAFAALYRREVDVPLRTAIDMEPDNGGALFMPVYSSSISRVGVKTVIINRDNPARGLPFIHAMVQIFDSSTGAPVALMDGEVITAMRTGAVSGLATKLLAKDNAKIAAIIGTGAQGETQLEGVCCVRDITTAYVFDLDIARAEDFAARMSKHLGIKVVVAQSSEQLTEADIICTSTSSTKPVFDDVYIKRGTHINGVGSYRPDMAEIPAQTLQRAKVVVDQRQGCLAEAGDLVQPIKEGIFSDEIIHGDLGEVVTGNIVAREDDEEVTVFKSVGIAVQDLVTADLALKLAESMGGGQEIIL